MLWTRTDIEAVLRKHGVICAQTEACRPSVTHQCTTLVTDLLSLQPPAPSKEQLDWIFTVHDNAYDSSEAWRAGIKKHLLAWATGQREPERDWCKNIKWNPDTDCYEFPLGHAMMVVDPRWTVCPICAEPRPK